MENAVQHLLVINRKAEGFSKKKKGGDEGILSNVSLSAC